MKTLGCCLLLVTAGSVVVAGDIQTISKGQQVDIKDHLVPGKYVLFDFYAEWCGPCRMIEPTLRDLADRNPETLALRKVDIVDWKSPVTQQYHISSVPHLKLFGPQGELLQDGDAGAVIRTLESRLGSKARAPGIDGRPVRETSRSAIPFVLLVVCVGVAAALYFMRRKPGAPTMTPYEPRRLRPAPATGGGDEGPAMWFVMMQGSLEGPFSVEQLEDLKRRKCIAADAQVRRRGDARWSSLSELI